MSLLCLRAYSRCGYTESNYDQLQQLYEKVRDRVVTGAYSIPSRPFYVCFVSGVLQYQKSGLEILAWPCNQFGHQVRPLHTPTD